MFVALDCKQDPDPRVCGKGSSSVLWERLWCLGLGLALSLGTGAAGLSLWPWFKPVWAELSCCPGD